MVGKTPTCRQTACIKRIYLDAWLNNSPPRPQASRVGPKTAEPKGTGGSNFKNLNYMVYMIVTGGSRPWEPLTWYGRHMCTHGMELHKSSEGSRNLY